MPGELKLAKGSSYYYSDRLSVGVYVKDKTAILIDSGIDKGKAKEVNTAIKKLGLTVGAIINTHSHADHCGGNNYFETQYKGLKIYATEWEKPFIEDARMEATCFCCGAEPHAALKEKLITIEKSSKVTNTIAPYKDQVIDVCGVPMSVVTLPGHTPGMIGIKTPDDILYCGDAAFLGDTFHKHGVLFYTNMKDTMASFDKMAALKIAGCVFYHGGYQEGGLAATVEQHRKKVIETMQFVAQQIQKGPHSIDEITQAMMVQYGVRSAPVNFTLTRTCAQAYVTCLETNQNLFMDVKDGMLVAKATVKPGLPFGATLEVKEEKQQSTAHLGKDAIKGFSSYQAEEFESKGPNKNISLSLGFDKNLTGDMHADAVRLKSIQTISDLLKEKNIVKNEKTHVEFGSGFDPEYKLPASDLLFRGTGGSKDVSADLAKIVIFEDRIELKLNNIPASTLEQLVKNIQELGLTKRLETQSPSIALASRM